MLTAATSGKGAPGASAAGRVAAAAADVPGQNVKISATSALVAESVR
jgi:hypothetical protein